jgi:hypothetical protein
MALEPSAPPSAAPIAVKQADALEPVKQVETPKPGIAGKVSFDFNDLSLSECCKKVSALSGMTVLCDVAVAGRKITLKVTDIPTALALQWLARIGDVDLTNDPDGSSRMTAAPIRHD